MLGDAIEYPFEGEETLETFLLGGALYLLSPFVLPGILLGGYSVAVARAVLEGRPHPPSFGERERYFRDGLSVLAITIVYTLPGLVIAGIVVFVYVLALLFGVDGGLPVVLPMGIGTVVGFAYSLAVAYLLPAAVVNYARADELGAAWDFDTLRTIVTDGEFATAWVLATLVWLVASSVGGALSVFIVGFVVLFYGQVAATYLYASGTMAALDVSPEPPTPPTSSGDSGSGATDAGDASTPSRSASAGTATDEAGSWEEDGTADDASETSGGTTDDVANQTSGGTSDDDSGERTDRALEDVDGVGPATAESLRETGYETAVDLEDATREDLADVDGIGPAKADQIKRDVGGA